MPTSEQLTAALNESFTNQVLAGHVLAIATAMIALKEFDPIVPAKEISRVVERNNKGQIVAVEKATTPAHRRNPNTFIKRRMLKAAYDSRDTLGYDHPYFSATENIWRSSKAWDRAKLLAKSPELSDWIENVDRWLKREGDASTLARLNRRCTAIARKAWSRGQAASAQQAAA